MPSGLTTCTPEVLKRRQAREGPPVGSALELEHAGVDTTTVVAGGCTRVVAGDSDAAVGLTGFWNAGDEGSSRHDSATGDAMATGEAAALSASPAASSAPRASSPPAPRLSTAPLPLGVDATSAAAVNHPSTRGMPVGSTRCQDCSGSFRLAARGGCGERAVAAAGVGDGAALLTAGDPAAAARSGVPNNRPPVDGSSDFGVDAATVLGAGTVLATAAGDGGESAPKHSRRAAEDDRSRGAADWLVDGPSATNAWRRRPAGPAQWYCHA